MDKSNFGQIVSFLFGIANDCLVDTYDVGDYRKIILPMMVIRRFDAVLEPTKEKVLKMKAQLDAAGITEQDEALCSVAGEAFCNSSPYTLSDLKSRTNQQQLKADFILYLNGFSQNVQDIIKRFEFRNQIDKLSEHDILGLLISKFTDSTVNLSNRPVYDAQGNIVQPALDNHTMGTVFEEVIRKFNEETNITDAGRHFTPRDIVELITDLAFVPVKDKIQSTTYRIYDGACGTGGMLTVAEERIQEIAKETDKKISIHLYGQENSDETYAIARSDMLVKGEGTIVHKFQFILDDIGEVHKDKNFAILIDEAHSSQNGSLSAKMNMVLSGSVYEDEDELEDKINTIIEGRKMVKNASYFAFTATPKNKTLEMFGKKVPLPDGTTKPEPHYVYTMKQAIEEGFIMDVLKYFTPVQSYYKLAKTVEDDPQFDKKRAQRLLRYYVESNQYAIHEKSKIIVEHFHTEVIAKGKVGGKARAMVISSSIKRAIEYYKEISKLLEERKSPFKAIVAFSGTAEYEGKQVTEADLNGFPSAKIEKTFKADPYRILIVANKFQTGFDEPLLHTMYVDKGLSDIKAVQTLSRLNRSHPDKKDTFILDFVNEPGIIKQAFDRYYKTTILSGETDVNKLNDLIDTMESIQVFSDQDVDTLVERYLANEPREVLDPILDRCVEVYKDLIMEDQIDFKSSAKTFVRTYNFLSAILPYGSIQWEKLSIFLTLLLPKLPKPEGEDYTEGLLEDVDLESYRAEAQETMRIQLENENGEIAPVPVSTSTGIDVPELDSLTNILKEFHDIFGNIEWTDEDKVKKQINDIIESVRKDERYNNAMQYSDKQNARDESDRAAHEAVLNSMQSGLELFREVQNNPSFRKWLFDSAFNSTYQTNSQQHP